jgi:hypothetical protein
VKPTFQGEVQFAAFSDSSRGGPRVTLRLADRSELDRFIGAEGKRFMAVLVEIADDETPAEPEKSAPARPAVQRERMAPLCEWAVYRCAEAEFQRWAITIAAPAFGYAPPADASPEDQAKAVVCYVCGVSSRKMLDTDPRAAAQLHKQIRQPYSLWLKEGATA